MWVSDMARHLNSRAPQLVAESLGIAHSVVVTNSALTNGMVERMIHGLLRTFKALPAEGRRPLADWVLVVPIVP